MSCNCCDNETLCHRKVAPLIAPATHFLYDFETGRFNYGSYDWLDEIRCDLGMTKYKIGKEGPEEDSLRELVTSGAQWAQCRICGEDFMSRNRLFKHLRQQSHLSDREVPIK